MTKSKSRRGGTWRESYMNVLMKRKNCKHMVFTNLLIALLLAGLISVAVWRVHALSDGLEKYDHEVELLHGSNIMSFDHCSFDSRYYSSEFNMERCFDQCGVKAIAWRHRKLNLVDAEVFRNGKQQYICLDILHEVECHTEHRNCVLPPKTLPACAGVLGVQLDDKIHNRGHVWAAAHENLSAYIGQDLLSSEIVARCPVCRHQSDWFTFEKNPTSTNLIECRAKLATISRGWPAYVEYCDNLSIKFLPASSCAAYNDQVETNKGH